MSYTVPAYDKAPLDPTGTDFELCSRIVEASAAYKRRGPLSIGNKWKTKTTNAYTQGENETQWLRKVRDAANQGGDPAVASAFQDFTNRYHLAFQPAKAIYRWSHHLTAEQFGLVVACLTEVRDDLTAAVLPAKKIVVLLSRSPYALYERMRVSWCAHHPYSALLFPEPLRTSYPEKIELADFVNFAPPAVWPDRPKDPLAWELGQWPTWLNLIALLEESTAAVTDRLEDVPAEAERRFLRRQAVTCLAAFRTDAAHAWYERALPIVQYEFGRVVKKIREEAEWYLSLYGPFWTVRHLHQYTPQALNNHLLSTVSVLHFELSDPFPDPSHVHAHQTIRELTAASLAHGRDGNYRRNRVYYGRQ